MSDIAGFDFEIRYFGESEVVPGKFFIQLTRLLKNLEYAFHGKIFNRGWGVAFVGKPRFSESFNNQAFI